MSTQILIHPAVEIRPRIDHPAWALLVAAAHYVDAAARWLAPPLRSRVWCALVPMLFVQTYREQK